MFRGQPIPVLSAISVPLWSNRTSGHKNQLWNCFGLTNFIKSPIGSLDFISKLFIFIISYHPFFPFVIGWVWEMNKMIRNNSRNQSRVKIMKQGKILLVKQQANVENRRIKILFHHDCTGELFPLTCILSTVRRIKSWFHVHRKPTHILPPFDHSTPIICVWRASKGSEHRILELCLLNGWGKRSNTLDVWFSFSAVWEPLESLRLVTSCEGQQCGTRMTQLPRPRSAWYKLNYEVKRNT